MKLELFAFLYFFTLLCFFFLIFYGRFKYKANFDTLPSLFCTITLIYYGHSFEYSFYSIPLS